ncbi:threonine aldolase family protein [Planctomyces sp. SH-PL14]|uniref:threonine aldolase family protein n=1 Tax=Planctomyces sp. SH-PL14 TaxID=1632864 RepID=UPI001E332904|nr:GntG family PLP-dependent aldolase [Planctomyces sp. SH-PL14]
MPDVIELRSDTFTQPTAGMRKAMAEAECGDDMSGEDPTVNRLEARMAEMLGKEGAVFACSGTQSNQMGVWAHCQRGEELLIEETGHIANYEAGAPAVLSGVSIRRIPGDMGRIDVPQLEAMLRAPNQHFTPTRLVCVENSANIGGGATYSLDQLRRIGEWTRAHKMRLHMDGARMFNACVARGYSPREMAEGIDSVSICFSKGLGCPMGSMLVGSAEVIAQARRARKIFGGALRQAGIVAAAAVYALDHHVERLKEDHDNARVFAEIVSRSPVIRCEAAKVETNLVFFEVAPEWGTAADLSTALRERGVKINGIAKQRLRACTHLDVNREQVRRAAEIVVDLVSHPRKGGVGAKVAGPY